MVEGMARMPLMHMMEERKGRRKDDNESRPWFNYYMCGPTLLTAQFIALVSYPDPTYVTAEGVYITATFR